MPPIFGVWYKTEEIAPSIASQALIVLNTRLTSVELLMFGNGVAGMGTSRDLQNGSHPCFTSNTSS